MTFLVNISGFRSFSIFLVYLLWQRENQVRMLFKKAENTREMKPPLIQQLHPDPSLPQILSNSPTVFKAVIPFLYNLTQFPEVMMGCQRDTLNRDATLQLLYPYGSAQPVLGDGVRLICVCFRLVD